MERLLFYASAGAANLVSIQAPILLTLSSQSSNRSFMFVICSLSSTFGCTHEILATSAT